MNPVTVSPVWQRLLQDIARQLQACGAQPGRSVVLLPYAQLLPVAQRQWALLPDAGLLPRFETTTNWAMRRAPFVAGPSDLTGGAAQGLLVAERLLVQAGQRREAAWLAARVRDAALQLMPLAAAQEPAQRAAWGQRLLPELLRTLGADALHYETVVAQVALLWASHSDYATDGLFGALERDGVEALVVLRGFQQDPLVEALFARWHTVRPDAAWAWDLPAFWQEHARLAHGDEVALSPIQLHAARDREDEAALAAAAVQQEVVREQGLVALVDSDRALTRRIRALLEAQQLTVRDETGWKLSTTRAASQVMSLLRACAPLADSDAVLEWLKLAQAVPKAADAVPAVHVQAVEAWLRAQGLARWPSLAQWKKWEHAVAGWVQGLEQRRLALQAARSLPQWLQGLRELLEHTGQWQWLLEDTAGEAVLEVLHMQPGAPPLAGEEAQARWTLEDFSRWVQDVLEAGSFKPPYPLREQVVILPMSQLLARPFAAVVVPGCDEVRLPSAPEPAGDWTPTQRALLGLPDRGQLQAAQRGAWEHMLHFPQVVLLGSRSEPTGEALLPSPLLLETQYQAATETGRRALGQGNDIRLPHALAANSVHMPHPSGSALPLLALSASAYDTLRACPYQFFGQQQLRLREVAELQGSLEKRDFGSWLHKVLYLFHLRWQQRGGVDTAQEELVRWMDAAAQDALEQEGLDQVDFVPYQSVWPRLRDGYLRWLLEHRNTQQAEFASGEQWRERRLADIVEALGGTKDEKLGQTDMVPDITLLGTIDRIDHLTVPAGDDGTTPAWLLLDYKSESAQKTRERTRRGADEDTQLPFYAALLAPEPVRVAYVNVGESGETDMHEHTDIARLTDQLVRGMASDLGRIAAGAELPALGQGARCGYCAMRGLCRRDFWEGEA